MYINSCRELIKHMKKNIIALKHISFMSHTIYEKMFYDNLIYQEIYIINTLNKYIKNMEQTKKFDRDTIKHRQKIFTIEELKKYDGKNNKPAYIAVDGIVYDVTFEPTWAGGTHFGMKAGNDVTTEFKSCHEEQKKLDKLKKVGVLKK